MIGVALLLAAAPPIVPPPRRDEAYGDWVVTRLENGTTIAAVSNNGGSTFGTICSRKGCTAFFNPKIECEDDSHYAALVNAPGASFSVSLECEKIDDMYLLSFPLEGEITEAMAVGGVLGIAFPMQSGQFQVARFSLTGAARASARASQLAGGPQPDERKQASDNLTL